MEEKEKEWTEEKVLKNREKKKKKGSYGGGTTQHTKFIMLYVLLCFVIITGKRVNIWIMDI